VLKSHGSDEDLDPELNKNIQNPLIREIALVFKCVKDLDIHFTTGGRKMANDMQKRC
jgi:hypothetical protein